MNLRDWRPVSLSLSPFKLVLALLSFIIILSACQKNEVSSVDGIRSQVVPKKFPDAEVLKHPESFIPAIRDAIKAFDQFNNADLKSTRGDSLVHKSDARILLQGLGNFRH